MPPQPRTRPLIAAAAFAAWLVVLGVFWIGLRVLFLSDYNRIEETLATRELQRVLGAIETEQDTISRWTGDWALWDENYEYMRGTNPGFADENFTPEVLDEIGADVVLLIEAGGQVRTSRWREEPGGEMTRPLSRRMLAAFLGYGSLHSPGLGSDGVASTPDGLYFTASRPITRADRSGTGGGWLIIARRLDARMVGRLQEKLRLNFHLDEVPVGLDAAPRSGIHLSPDGKAQVAYGSLYAPGGAPSATVSVVNPRELYAQAEAMAGTLLAVGGGALALMFGLLGSLLSLLREGERRRRDAQALHDFVAAQSSDGVLLVDPQGGVRHVSGATARLVGVETTADVDRACAARLLAAASTEASTNWVAPIPGAEGAMTHVEVTLSSVEIQGTPLRCLALRDVSERVRDEERMRFLAFHDALTSLPNRILFQDRLAQALAAAERSDAGLAVAFLDLDHFKSVNDALGHDHADALLVEVARRIHDALRPGDTVARQGGDEFLLLLPGVRDASGARIVCERLLDVVRQPIVVGHRDLGVSASIGVALFPSDGRDPTTLVKNADLAMYKAKQSGRNVWQLVDGSLHERLARIADLRSRLMRAVENNELVLHYQPQVDPRTGAIVALEALVRWLPPGESLIPPGVFIPVAEETGLIVPIGEWVLREACRQLQEWRAAGVPLVRVGVNVSALQFAKAGLTGLVFDTLVAERIDPALLEIEITESVAMANPAAVRAALIELAQRGVGVALDDFGTGHSSLASLRSLPFTRLKIDRAFLGHIDEDRADQTVVAAIVALAHALRMEVIAEGVERSAQHSILAQLGCDLLQGYGLYRPAPASDIAELLLSRRPLRHVEVH